MQDSQIDSNFGHFSFDIDLENTWDLHEILD